MKKWGFCVLALLIVVAPVLGSGFRGSGPAQSIGGGLGVASWDDEHAFALPSAVMFWSKNESSFHVLRYIGSSSPAVEEIAHLVPAGATLTLPAVRFLGAGNTNFALYLVTNFAVGDTVYAVPLYR